MLFTTSIYRVSTHGGPYKQVGNRANVTFPFFYCVFVFSCVNVPPFLPLTSFFNSFYIYIHIDVFFFFCCLFNQDRNGVHQRHHPLRQSHDLRMLRVSFICDVTTLISWFFLSFSPEINFASLGGQMSVFFLAPW